MVAVENNGSKITVPDVSGDPLFSWINENREGDPPMIGTLPNRFEASASDPMVAARAAEEAVQEAWKRIADAVWDKFVAGVADGGGNTKEIWERQVCNFWEISWAVGSIDSMNYRKNWRYHRPPVEGGDHCTMMGDWQELSGFIRSKEPGRQNEFWTHMQNQETIGNLNLRKDERLCAIALIKRLFPTKVSEEAIGWPVKAENWPSTLYVAAVPWLKTAAEKDPEGAKKYSKTVLDTAPGAGRECISSKIKSLNNLEPREFLDLDGNFYFERALDDCHRTPLEYTPTYLDKCEEEPELVRSRRVDLKGQLKALCKNAGCSPPLFYALLMMDGDRMGVLIQNEGGERVSKALAAFTKKVEGTVSDHNGVTIYAGGDDVLAMLPLPDALSCALDLSEIFESAFKRVVDIEPTPTISAGLVFSHYHVPLRTVYQEAHDILDDVAKDQNGRGSIAVSVLKNSGKYCQWTSTWKRPKAEKKTTQIDELVDRIGRSDKEKQFSNSFFFNMRDTFALLSDDPVWKPGSYTKLVGGLEPVPLLTAEYMRSREQEVTQEEAKKRVEELLELCYQYRRKDGEPCVDKKNLSSDGVMLVKFLSQAAEGGGE